MEHSKPSNTQQQNEWKTFKYNFLFCKAFINTLYFLFTLSFSSCLPRLNLTTRSNVWWNLAIWFSSKSLWLAYHILACTYGVCGVDWTNCKLHNLLYMETCRPFSTMETTSIILVYIWFSLRLTSSFKTKASFHM
jgi:hypothetical protein